MLDELKGGLKSDKQFLQHCQAGFMVLAKNDDVQQLIKPTDEHRRMIVRNRHLLEYIGGQNKPH
jgi:hypothetical protein